MLQWYDFIFFLLSSSPVNLSLSGGKLTKDGGEKCFSHRSGEQRQIHSRTSFNGDEQKKKQDIDTFRRYRRIHLILGDNSDDDAWTFPVITLIAMICKLPFSLARRFGRSERQFSAPKLFRNNSITKHILRAKSDKTLCRGGKSIVDDSNDVEDNFAQPRFVILIKWKSLGCLHGFPIHSSFGMKSRIRSLTECRRHSEREWNW